MIKPEQCPTCGPGTTFDKPVGAGRWQCSRCGGWYPQRPGRPSKPATDSRKVRTYYATDAEYAAMQAKAEAAGTDLSGLIRRAILGQG